MPLIMVFALYEQAESGTNGYNKQIAHWRLIIGLLLVCTGLAASAAISIANPQGVTGVRLWVVAMPFIGAAFVGIGPLYGLLRRLEFTS